MKSRSFLLLALIAITFLISMDAVASTSSVATPLDGPFDKFLKIISGKWVFSIGVIALIITLASLLLGGQMNDAVKAVMGVVFICALALSASNVFFFLFGSGVLL